MRRWFARLLRRHPNPLAVTAVAYAEGQISIALRQPRRRAAGGPIPARAALPHAVGAGAATADAVRSSSRTRFPGD